MKKSHTQRYNTNKQQVEDLSFEYVPNFGYKIDEEYYDVENLYGTTNL